MAFELPFAAKTPPLIGLDIGSSSVKIVELSEAGKGMMRLERYAIEPLPRGAVVDGNVDKIDVEFFRIKPESLPSFLAQGGRNTSLQSYESRELLPMA